MNFDFQSQARPPPHPPIMQTLRSCPQEPTLVSSIVWFTAQRMLAGTTRPSLDICMASVISSPHHQAQIPADHTDSCGVRHHMSIKSRNEEEKHKIRITSYNFEKFERHTLLSSQGIENVILDKNSRLAALNLILKIHVFISISRKAWKAF